MRAGTSRAVVSSVIGLNTTVDGHAEDAVAEHAAIYQAIGDGEPGAAPQAAALHIDNTVEDYRREIQRHVSGQPSVQIGQCGVDVFPWRARLRQHPGRGSS